jgi:hypothetical protein
MLLLASFGPFALLGAHRKTPCRSGNVPKMGLFDPQLFAG